MFDAFVRFLIAIVVVAGCLILFFFIVGAAGFTIPSQLVLILWILAGLLLLLYGYRLFKPHLAKIFPPSA